MKVKVQKVLQSYIEVLPAEQYRIQLVYSEEAPEVDKNKKPQKRIWSADQLVKGVSFLKYMNAKGFHIYARPLSYQYIFLDDIKPKYLPELEKIKPAIILESSPENYQAFVKFKNIPNHREEALLICKELANLFNADSGSAEPDHLGRLPGFTNRKPKRKIANGIFPFVKIVSASTHYTTFLPNRDLCSYTQRHDTYKKRTMASTGDRSREDFAITCQMLKRGVTDHEIFDVLINRDKAKEKGKHDRRYVEMTLRNAKRRLRII